MTLICHFSKWAMAFPIPNNNAETVARILAERVFPIFGPPRQLLSDRGPEFESQVLASLCSWYGIDKLRTTAYKPSSNGAIERYHTTLNSMLAKVVSDNRRDWCMHVPTVAAAYRASIHEATQYTPNLLMFGREIKAPADCVLDVDDRNKVLFYDFVWERAEMIASIYQRLRGLLGKAAVRRKEYCDVAVNESAYKTGDLVWYLDQRRRQGLSPK